jgi:succinate dehydrogenase / fumarate reductase, cytochrome b subunit
MSNRIAASPGRAVRHSIESRRANPIIRWLRTPENVVRSLDFSLRKETILKPVLKFLSSSVGKKFVMGITGLLLCGFLVTHLAGNLLMYVSPQAYNSYAHTLHSQAALLRVAEVALYALFILHIYLAFRTTQENRAARRSRYAIKRSKLDVAPHTTSWPLHPEAWMFVSGAIVLFFLIVHLSDFAWEIRLPGKPGEEVFNKTIRILNDNVTAVIYLVGTVILGVHLWHGFSSAFQSLGFRNSRYEGLIKWTGVVFATLIGLGFASFVFFARMAPSATLAR